MSGFKIGTNLSGMAASRNLNIINDRQHKSIERLSSGQRINKAADDAAGLAISERFKAQISGINRAIFNLQDGISLLQIAEGGVENISDMLQRIRSLAVQAANDTLTTVDRTLIQKEVNHLLQEIDRQASTVSFNQRVLLTGNFTGVSVPIGAPVSQTFDSNGVVAGDANPNYYRVSLANPTATGPEPPAGAEFIDADYVLSDTVDGTFRSVLTGIVGNNMTMRFQFNPGVTASDVTSLQFNFVGGSDANGASPDNIRYQLYDFQANGWVDVGNNNTGTLLAFTAGTTNAQTTNPSRFFDTDGDVWAQAWVETDVAVAGSNQLAIDFASLQVTTQQKTPGETIQIQAGANKGEAIDLTLPDARTSALGLTGLTVTTQSAAANAIATADAALTEINGARAEIGAMQNRLEGTGAFSAIQKQNMSAANSRIRDLDFGAEIVQFTKDQILQQSATSAIAQANLNPQAILQLLR